MPVALLSSLLKKIYHVLDNYSLGNAANHRVNVQTSVACSSGVGLGHPLYPWDRGRGSNSANRLLDIKWTSVFLTLFFVAEYKTLILRELLWKNHDFPFKYLILQTNGLQHRRSFKMQEVFVFLLPKLRNKICAVQPIEVQASEAREHDWHFSLLEPCV